MKHRKTTSIKIEVVELDRNGFHLFISVKVDEKKCRFLIDTGASHSVIDKVYYKKNMQKKKLKTIKQSTTGLHSSTAESHFGKIKELKLGDVLIKGMTIAAVDLTHVNKTYALLKKKKINGIIGSDILFALNGIIDYGQQKLFLS
jgi:predicted aspartyl protease